MTTADDLITVRTFALGGSRGYGVRLELGASSWSLTRADAQAYAAAFVAAITTAEHDTAVFNLLTGRLGLSQQMAAAFLLEDLRPDRPTPTHAGPVPFELKPGVGIFGAFVSINLDGTEVGQLGTDACRVHAVNVLAASAAADLDSALRRALVGTLGLEEARASQVVASLGEQLHGEDDRG